MKVETALRQGLDLLREGRVGAPSLTAELLLAHALHRDRTYLLTHPEHELSELEWIHYGRSLHERLQGKPTQYITHTQEFWGRDFRVEKGVLIPRPETEHVIETALSLLSKSDRPAPLAPSQHSQSPETPQQAQCGAGTGQRGAGTAERGAGTGQRGAGTPACRVDTPVDARRVLDIGSGSGILAVTLALESKARVFATETSAAALRIAHANAAR